MLYVFYLFKSKCKHLSFKIIRKGDVCMCPKHTAFIPLYLCHRLMNINKVKAISR